MADTEHVERLAHRVKESAEAIGVGESTMWNLIGSGEIRSITVGRRRLVPHTELVDFIERRRAESSA